MPEPQTDTTTAPGAPTTDTTPAAAVPATATPAQAPPPTPSQPPAGQQPALDRNDVYDDQGRKWKDRFHGYTGALSQQRQQAEAAAQELRDQIATLTQQLEQEQSGNTGLQTQLTDLQAQVELIPTLNDQITQLQAAQVLHEKLSVMMEYPQLLGLSVTETVAQEDGTEKEVTHNPIRHLVESSTLEGDALRRQIEQLARLHQVSAEPTAQFNTPTVPSPAGPAAETAESAREQALKLQQDLILGGDYSQAARTKIQEAWQRVAELETQAAD